MTDPKADVVASSKDPELLRAQQLAIEWLRLRRAGVQPTAPTFTLLGLSDLADVARFPKQQVREWCAIALGELAANWPQHLPHHRELAATLHRLGWSLLNVRDPRASNADDENGSDLTHEVSMLVRAAERMQHHPHALLALRCSGLVYSKRNRYTSSWLSFGELRTRAKHWERATVTSTPPSDDDTTAKFAEVREQALLAETGTAARVVEHRLGSWITDIAGASPRFQRLAYHEAYGILLRGVTTGALADEQVEHMDLAEFRSSTRIGVKSWVRRPGVMTARCHLTLIPLCRVVEEYRTKHPTSGAWDLEIEHHWSEFVRFYERAQKDPRSVSLDKEHARELIQLRLHALLVYPDRPLPPLGAKPSDSTPACLLSTAPTRDELAEALLALNSNANLAASISAPSYLAWMQRISGDDSMIDWLLSKDRDHLRRTAAKPVFSEHREAIRATTAVELERINASAGGSS